MIPGLDSAAVMSVPRYGYISYLEMAAELRTYLNLILKR